MNRLIARVRQNSVAYLALFVALGGTSCAAIALANHSIDPVKLDSKLIGGYVRAWARVSGGGHIVVSSGQVRVHVERGVGPGHYILRWRPRPTSRCTATGSVDFTGGGPVPGYMASQSVLSRGEGEQTAVQTYSAQGEPSALSFDVELVCATP
jgi:hypothetical protein